MCAGLAGGTPVIPGSREEFPIPNLPVTSLGNISGHGGDLCVFCLSWGSAKGPSADG